MGEDVVFAPVAFVLVPFIFRGWLIFRHRHLMRAILCEMELDRAAHRSMFQGMSGFSFAGLLATIALDRALRTSFELAAAFLFSSFLFYLVAMNLQSYKAQRWQDQLGDSFADAASLGLILAIVASMCAAELNSTFLVVAAVLSLFAWLTDFIVRFRITHADLKRRGDINGAVESEGIEGFTKETREDP